MGLNQTSSDEQFVTIQAPPINAMNDWSVIDDSAMMNDSFESRALSYFEDKMVLPNLPLEFILIIFMAFVTVLMIGMGHVLYKSFVNQGNRDRYMRHDHNHDPRHDHLL